MSFPAAFDDRTTSVVESAAALAGTAWDQVDPADLPATAAGLARAKAMIEAAEVDVAERLAATGAATDLGWASTKDFLTHVAGGRKGAGGAMVRTADQTSDLPAVRDALRAGLVSLPQARTIAGRVATLPRVPELRTAAADKLLTLVQRHGYDATDLQHAFPNVVAELDPDGTLLRADLDRDLAERGAHHARYLSFAPDTHGGVRIRGYASVEEAEQVKTVLMPLAAPQTSQPGACGGDPDLHDILGRGHKDRFAGKTCPTPACAHDGRDPREHGVRMWDALVEACDRLTATDALPRTHGSRTQVTVTMDYEALRTQLSDGVLPTGATLPASTIRRMACDADIIPAVLGTHHQVLDLGRSHRLVTTALFQALVVRDHHCAFPGCTRLPIACDAHHITHWADGGPTSLDNLVLLCRRHHTLTHHTPWTVELDPDTRRPRWHPPPRRADDRDHFTYIPAQRPPRLVA